MNEPMGQISEYINEGAKPNLLAPCCEPSEEFARSDVFASAVQARLKCACHIANAHHTQRIKRNAINQRPKRDEPA